MAFNDLLPHTVEVQRRVLTDDNMGGHDINYVSIGNELLRIWSTREVVEQLDSGKAVKSIRRMASKKTADIRSSDKIIDGNYEYFVIKKYNVFAQKVLHHYEYSLSLHPLDIDST